METYSTSFNNDLLIKNNSADMVMRITVVDYNDVEKHVTFLFDSSDNWSHVTRSNDLDATFGIFAGQFLLTITEHDHTAKIFFVEMYQVINGTTQEYCKVWPFVRDGKRFRRASVTASGKITFLKEDEV